MAPGFGAGWAELDVDDEQPAAEISLRPEQIILGRLLDVQGQPIPGVTVSVRSISRVLPTNPATGHPRFEGVSHFKAEINDLPAWPKPATTNAEGRFTLRGVGRDLRVSLTTHHPRFALQTIEVVTDGTSESKSLTATLVPAQILTGRVTYADTGKGVPHAPLGVMSGQGRIGILSDFETDDEGRFRVKPPPADRSFNVTAFPPQGQPYLIATNRLEWPKGAIEQSLDLALPRGALIRGTVTEEGSGKPVSGATVDFIFSRRAAESARAQYPGQYRARRLVSARRRAGPRLPLHQGPQRRLRARGDRQSDGRARPAGRHADVRARAHRARTEAGHRHQGNPPHSPPRRDGEGPARRAGWPARPRCLDLQPDRPRSETRGIA